MKRIQIYQGLLVPTQHYTNATLLFLHRPGLHPAAQSTAIRSVCSRPWRYTVQHSVSKGRIQTSHHRAEDGCWLLLQRAHSEQRLAVYIALLASLSGPLHIFLSLYK